MLIKLWRALLIVSLLAVSVKPSYAFRLAKVSIKVVDETGKAIDAARTELCLKGGCLTKDAIRGISNSDGIFVASGNSPDGVIGGSVEKEGYYNSTFHNDFVRSSLGMWQPWNKELKVVLRQKLEPIPMYARHRWVKVPVVGKRVAFDLMKFDWVSPYGLGIVEDFIIEVDSKYLSYDDRTSTTTLSFSNKLDGIQEFKVDTGGDFGVGSAFRTPRYAPEAGYKNKITARLDTKSPGFSYQTRDIYYFFRVRSESNAKGVLRRALYGKIKGDFRARPTKDGLAEIELFYWLNPSFTRNMEFDPKANLFSPLPWNEQVAYP